MELVIKQKRNANSLWIIALPLLIFCALGAFIAIERLGINYNRDAQIKNLSFLPAEAIIPRGEHRPAKKTLIICNSMERETYPAIENIRFVLDQMSAGYDLIDLRSTRNLLPLSRYKSIIIACNSLDLILLSLSDLFSWVEAGGGLLIAQPPDDDVLLRIFYRELGIEQGNYKYIPQVWAAMNTDLLAGGKGIRIPWSDENAESDYREGCNFVLDETCTVHMTSQGPLGTTPMLWEHKFGDGRVVVNNNDAFAEPWSRGLLAAAYSLTETVMVHPVINASLFFIDDFPAPIPEGYNEFIQKDYGVMTEYFFVNVWFPDMLKFAKKHGIKYTSVFVESYNDNVNSPFEATPSFVTERMKYFGSLYLNEGFELGLHGYNHQSLVLTDFDYRDELPYNKWPSEDNMTVALRECHRLQEQLFPGNVMRTYVPPSNVLSPEGRAMLKRNFPNINTISDLLIDDIFNLRNDFGIGEDGLINLPRISSGFDPMDEDNDEQPFWVILNELNFHFVQSHFIHPDDVMDDERGALKGWRGLTKAFEEYLTWLDQFPIRNMTCQEAAPAVQRYDSLTVNTTYSEKSINIKLDGFYDEAWLFVRINEGVPERASGGSLTRINDRLYLLEAKNANVEIFLEQPDL